MSRPIEFRFWCPKKGVMTEGLTLMSIMLDYPPDEDTLKDVVPLQYTGLTDKAGQKIFEGDILRMLCNDWISKSDEDPRTLEQYLIDKSDIFIVVYVPNECRFGLRFNGIEESLSHYFEGFHPHGFIEVIGNIYQDSHLLNENPELLEGKDA